MRMGMVMPAILKLVTFCVIVFALALQGSTGLTNSPSPTTLSVIPLVEVPSRPSGNGKSFTSNPPSSESWPIGSFLPPELAAPPFSSPPEPLANNGLVPASPPSSPISGQREVLAVPPSPPLENAPVAKAPISMPIAQDAPPPSEVESHAPTVPPSASGGEEPVVETPSSTPVAPVATPSRISPAVNPTAPATSPPSVHQSNSSDSMSPAAEPITPVSAASPPPKELDASPPAPGLSSPSQAPQSSPFIHPSTPGVSPSMLPDHAIAPVSPPPPIANWENETAPVAAPSNENPNLPPPMTQIPALNGSDIAPAPSNLLPKSHSNRHPPTLSPSTSFKKPYNPRNKFANPTPAPSYPVSPPTSTQRGGPTVPPSPLPVRRRRQRASPPRPTPLTSDPSISSPLSHVSPTPAPSQKPSSGNPKIFPSKPPSASPKSPFIPPIRAFPPPPPNEDCSTTVCTEPYANTPPGSPCGCVLPIQVGLRLSVSLYTFFPLVSQLAQEIAAGVFIKQSQVRIIGANAANQQTDKTVVLVDLVPLGEKFDNTGAFFIYQRFWNKQVAIQKSFFGDYEVLYVRYPGLPESPPSSIGIVDDGPFPGANNSARKIKPLGVDVPKDQHKNSLSGGVIAVIVLSASLAVIFCSTAAWIFLFRRRDENFQPRPTPHVLLPTLSKPSGGPGSILGSRDSSATLSFGSSIATYTGSARTFSASDIEKATDHFDTSRVLGEGGFGRVYSGVLEDGTKVAVKVLKRDDQQGGREFLAEVEMLSRLHHRNLVKLIGICIEDRARCLVYELIPNGSVDSHLHGVDKESAPLNWGARVKIALGAARGLAYLHEDSSPRVIHRDFKSSNILLEDDFTPKVSDFGLARTALDEENRHISTRVMGTFGYVAPEYAMTGHLLVKSDVYSYGVVLLELLTGRIPVDMSQPPGQENLVAWAHPLLAGQDGLDMIIDRSLGPGIPLDSAAKVAAIASMCVQPEVSNRPFMGEVVQALKLVCNEIEEEEEGPGSPGGSSRNGDDLSIDVGPVLSQYSVHSYDELGLFGSASARLGTEESESFRRHSSSGPIGGRRSRRVWERVRTLSGGSISDGFRLRAGSN